MVTEIKKSNVLFWCEANAQIGLGHLYECLGVAEALSACGHSCQFLVSEYAPTQAILSKHQFDSRIYDEEQTINQNPASLGDFFDSLSGVVINHRAVKMSSMSWIKSKGLPLAVIDQLGGKAVKCDLLINASPVDEWHCYDYQGHQPRVLLGLDYVVLRNSFLSEMPNVAPNRQRDRRVLVTFGGVDRTGATLRVMEALKKVPDIYLGFVDVVLGPGFPHGDAMAVAKQSLDDRFVISSSVSDMARRMGKAAVAVNSGGTTLNELAHCQTPALVLWEDPHEELMGKAFQRLGAARVLGNGLAVPTINIAGAIQELLDEREVLDDMSRRSGVLVDGKGLTRIIKALRMCFHTL